jgi:hypothetical protein
MDEMRLINESIEQNGKNQFTIDEEAVLEQELNELMNSPVVAASSIESLSQLPAHPNAPISQLPLPTREKKASEEHQRVATHS